MKISINITFENKKESRRIMRNPDAPTLWIHWGRFGAGPKILFETVSADLESGATFVSFNPDAEISSQLFGLDVEKFPIPTYRSRIGVILQLPRLILNSLKLRRWIRVNNITRVVSTMESIYQSLSIPVLLPRQVEYISCIHDGHSHLGEGHVLQKIGRMLELRRADYVVTFSRSVRDILEPHVEVPIFVQDHPAFDADVNVLEPRNLPKKPLIGFFGRMQKYKGLELLLQSAHILRDQGLEFEIRIVGDGPESSLQHTELGNEATWDVRWIPETEISGIVGSFDIMVFPYIEASQSGPVTFALSHGIPCVSTPVGAIPDQVEGFGLVSADVSPESFAAELQRLISDSTLYQSLSANALTIKDGKFSWTDLVANIRNHRSIAK